MSRWIRLRRRALWDRTALAAAALYAAFGLAWILWSDRLLFSRTLELPLLHVLGQWKGFACIIVSAVVVYAAAARRSPARRKAAQAVGNGSDTRLAMLLAAAAAAIISIGVAAAVAAQRSKHEETLQLLNTVAATRTELFDAWLRERLAALDAQRAEPNLARLFGRTQSQPTDAIAHRELAAQLRALCAAADCLSARMSPHGGDTSPALSLPQAAGGAVGQAPIDVARAVHTASGAPHATLQLRFDALPELARLLHTEGGAALPGLHLALVQRGVNGRQLIEAEAGGGVRLSGLPIDGPLALPTRSAAGGSAPESFEATAPAGGTAIGVATGPVIAGWSLIAWLDRDALQERAVRDVLWITGAALTVLLLAGLAAYGMQQHRELLAARRAHAGRQDRLRALALLDAIAEGTPDVIFATDLEGRYRLANQAACRLMGLPAPDALGQRGDTHFRPAAGSRLATLRTEVVATGEVASSEVELPTAEGPRWFSCTIGPLREDDGRIHGLFAVLRDVTDRRHHEAGMRLWAQAFESARDGVVICNAQGRIERINRAFTEITGYAESEAVGSTPALLRSGRHDAAFYQEFWRCLTEEGVWRGEIWNRRKNGEVYPEWLTINSVRSPDGGELHYVGVFTDISRIKADEARLDRLANYDPLTELPNRRLLNARLGQALAQTRRHGGLMAVLSIDLDGFKTVNDSLGHPAGDELLLRVAQRLKNRLRSDDTLGRLGGDEFLVIATALHEPTDAGALAQQLLSIIGQPVGLAGGREAYITASIGISLFPGDGAGDVTAMLRDADAALYRAKEEGRNRYSFYTHDMNAQAVAKLETEAALSRALQRGELRLHYQPKVATSTGQLTGSEALLRWERDGDLVPPARFIPLAESSSLILDIGAWVIDEACRQWRAWADRGLAAPRIAVNVAARQFAAGDLDRVVTGALQRHGVPATALELELTESMLIDRPAESIALLTRLKDIGVTLSLDDFGTGYSNLAYLRQFPIDTLKIDQSFVAQISEGHQGCAIVDAVIALAHRLGLGVVAEGVETDAQKDHLRAQGCDELQGYAIGRPAAPEAFERLCGLAAPAEEGLGASSPAAAD